MPLLAFAGFAVGPHVPVAILRLRVAPGFLEPAVLVGGVIHDQVDQSRAFHAGAHRG